jgi:hypothetical protein
MNITEILQLLYARKARMEQAISDLEELQRVRSLPLPPPHSKRKSSGRKSMGAEERKEVSRRMKKYWANRRKDE